MTLRRWCLLLAILWGIAATAAEPLSRESVLAETSGRYDGPSERGVDTSTLLGKTMCGYQGWFNCEGDGAERGWFHWTKGSGPMAPGNAKVDLWPDVSELKPDERFATEFRHADGSAAEVFSSFNRTTVLRHFVWMRDYGIDGAFIQRFAGGLRQPRVLRHNNIVLRHCREGANRTGRAYALMYDLTGLRTGRIDEVMEDWRTLRSQMGLTEDSAYLRHRGKPLVAVWGIGFSDGRSYTLAECRKLVDALKEDGCAVMVGVPTYWRELKSDTLGDSALHELIRNVDVVSPWTVGRYRDLAGIQRYADKVLIADLEWCRDAGVDYLPVVFPGFSWHNMKGGPLDQIPRQKGAFLWAQFAAARRTGAQMTYVAMFDEVDEGTAIFKCTNDVPLADRSVFVTYEGLPSDFYLRLTGEGAKMMRGLIPLTDTPRSR